VVWVWVVSLRGELVLHVDGALGTARVALLADEAVLDLVHCHHTTPPPTGQDQSPPTTLMHDPIT
jgi:hypothetical protein